MRLEARSENELCELLGCSKHTIIRIKAQRHKRIDSALAFLGLCALEYLNQDDLKDLMEFYAFRDKERKQGRPFGTFKNKDKE